MQLVRVEDVQGNGPFRSQAFADEVLKIARKEGLKVPTWGAYHNQFDVPSEDPLIGYRWDMSRHLSAFSNDGQLREWFSPGMLRLLEDWGYTVLTVEVPDEDAIVGTQQAVFDPARAKAVTFRNPTELIH